MRPTSTSAASVQLYLPLPGSGAYPGAAGCYRIRCSNRQRGLAICHRIVVNHPCTACIITYTVRFDVGLLFLAVKVSELAACPEPIIPAS